MQVIDSLDDTAALSHNSINLQIKPGDTVSTSKLNKLTVASICRKKKLTVA